MPRLSLRMPSASGVPVGGVAGTATFKLPIGRRFHELNLAYSGITLAQMTEIRILANGKPFQTFSATDRDLMNQHDGLEAAAGVLVIPFDRPKLKTRQGMEDTAINTGVPDKDGRQITTFDLEVDIAAAHSGAAFDLHAEQSEAVAGGPGTMIHMRRFPVAFPGAGQFDIADLPKGGPTTLGINRIWMKPTANNVTEVIVERDTRNIWERKAARNTLLLKNGEKNPQSGFFVIDRTERRFGGDPIELIGVQDFRLRTTVDGAMTNNVTVEYLGVLGS